MVTTDFPYRFLQGSVLAGPAAILSPRPMCIFPVSAASATHQCTRRACRYAKAALFENQSVQAARVGKCHILQLNISLQLNIHAFNARCSRGNVICC